MVHELFDDSGAAEAGGGERRVVVLRLHVQPGPGRTAVQGRHGDALKVRVASPPEKSRANEACAALVAELADVTPAAVTLTSGETSRSKRFTVTGADVDELVRRLELALEDASGNARGRGSVPKSPGSR
ncbi:MAG TPA: DUF167 domain-containing protein [Acidimicrobiales bacterium]|nr:DUF167 domain-containing protein [Acidimicrobiales bacterium]